MGKVVQWPGLGSRIKEAIGRRYTNSRGNPDVMRFSIAHGFALNYVYRWIGGQTVPSYENLMKLATSLDVSPAWLTFGADEGQAVGAHVATAPIGGGGGEGGRVAASGSTPPGGGEVPGRSIMSPSRKPLAPVRLLPARRRALGAA